jgi:cell wall-associated NlpC family hydrolase
MLTDAQRKQLVKIAESWLGTRYRGWSAVKGPKGGVDCCQLLAAVYQEAALIPKDIDLPKDYPLNIGAHRASTLYIDLVLKHFVEIPESEVKPGDIVVWKLVNSLAYCHGAICVSWPDHFIHAYGDRVKACSARHRLLFDKSEKRFFTLKDGK